MQISETTMTSGLVARRLLVFALLGGLLSLPLAAFQTPEYASAVAHSVVRITATTSQGTFEGTGFVWSQPDYVVTALHVVAGAKGITVHAEGLNNWASSAKVVKVLLEADLALLQLDRKPSPLQPLRVAPAPPDLTKEHTIWGYPDQTPKIKGTTVRFELGLEQKTTFDSIYPSEDAFRKATGGNFPKFTAEVLDIQSILLHGHSGAPIINASGALVGIGDGGEGEGVRLANWGIPAQKYLSQLEKSSDPSPNASSFREALKSSAVSETVEVTQPGAERASGNGGKEETFRLVATSTLGEVIRGVSDEQQKDYDVLRQEADKAVGKPVFDDWKIDVYVDTSTGATIAVPHGVDFKFDHDEEILVARSEDHHVRMMVQSFHGDTPEDAKRAEHDFNHFIDKQPAKKFPGTEWQATDVKDEQYKLYHGKQRYSRKTRVLYDPRNKSQLYARVDYSEVINGNHFLGTALMFSNIKHVSNSDIVLSYVMTACARLATFSN